MVVCDEATLAGKRMRLRCRRLFAQDDGLRVVVENSDDFGVGGRRNRMKSEEEDFTGPGGAPKPKSLADDPAAVERAARKHFELSEEAYLSSALAVGFGSVKPTVEKWDDLRQSDRVEYVETMAEALRAAEGEQ